MRKACKSLTQLALALSLFATCAALARAQARDSRLVSARAGGVNLTVGDVTVRRAGQNSWQTLLRTDDLRDGDAVRTGADGRAEILLNPGSYLRLGENTEFEMTDTSLNALRLKVARGSAIIEASIPEGGSSRQTLMPEPPTKAATVIEATARYSDAFVILIDTPKTQALIVRSGVYRVNVAADGATELLVRSGRALFGSGAVVVKDGKVATLGAGGAVEVAKLDGKQKDDLDLWGKKRAEELARLNDHLHVRALNTMFARTAWDNFGWGYNPTGLWFWDVGALSYTYIPFYICRSPYGFYYRVAAPGLAWTCHCFNNGWQPTARYGIVNRVGPGPVTTGGNTSGGGSTVTSGGGGSSSAGGGGAVIGGGPTFGGGNAVVRQPAEPSPSMTTQHSGGGAAHRIGPPR